MTPQAVDSYRSRRSKLILSVALIGVGVLMSAVLAEGLLRFVPGLLSPELEHVIQSTPQSAGIAHPYIGHLHKPNNTFILAGRDFHATNHTDGHGFRNSWPWPETAEIVVVGDSLPFGYGVEGDQSWPALVAKQLPELSLVNLGLLGGGPQQYLRLYETFGEELQPKILLVGFFLRNDLWDGEMFETWLESGAAVNYVVWRDFGRPRSTRLELRQPLGDLFVSVLWRGHLFASRSQLYNLLHYVRRSFRDSVRGWDVSESATFETRDGTRLELNLGDFADKTKDVRPGNRRFDIAIDALQRLDSKARSNGTEMLVVFQPSKEEVYLPLLGEPEADPGRPLREKLGELGIDYLDLLPDFRRRAAEGEALFFEVDGHPNVRGYALTANLVLAHLTGAGKWEGLTGAREDRDRSPS